MAMIDYGLLVKVLSRTQSNHDPEVLVAIKKANEMLSKAGLQWHQVIVMLHGRTAGNGAEFEADFNTDALRRATEHARASRFGEDLRKRQAERDQAYSAAHEQGDAYAGWTHKGPFTGREFYDGVHVYSKPYEDEMPPEDEIELRARDQTEHINGEAQQTNWFCFAMTEPAVADWLFKLREGHAFHRILYAQVLDRGELSVNQLGVCNRMMRRDQRSTPR